MAWSTRAGSTSSGVTLARLTANAKLVNGSGQVRAAFAGRRGAAFEFSTLAEVSPDTIRLTGNGRIEREPLVLNQAAVLTRSGDGWALAPTSLSFRRRHGDRLRAAAARVPEVHAQVRGHAAGSARHRLAQARPVRARRPGGSIMRGRATATAGSI